MIAAGDFKNGTTFELDGQIFRVIEFQHVKTGRGGAFVRTKLKNVITGATVERTFNATEKVPKAELEKREMQYLYNDGTLYYFMDAETYEQLPINKELLEDALKFIKENMMVKALFHKGTVIGVEPPTFVELQVIHTEPGFKGDTATGATKPATVETGATLQVPLFINVGDIIKIDTRTGTYIERV